MKNQDIKFITAKGHLKFANDEMSVEGKLNLYLIRDSVCLVVIKKLGIELSRILITKDSFNVIDRISETYSLHALDELTGSYQIPLEFHDIFQIVSSACFLDPDIYYEFKKNKNQCSLSGTSESHTLNYQLDTLSLLPKNFEAIYHDNKLTIEVIESEFHSEKLIPTKQNISVSGKRDQTMNIQINWDEIKLDPITTLSFRIPPHYTKT